MQIVIKIPKEVYEQIIEAGDMDYLEVITAIENGTTLPEGHGDLIDVNRKITVPTYDEQYEEWGERILTVREALDRWSDEGITAKDVVISADMTESEEQV